MTFRREAPSVQKSRHGGRSSGVGSWRDTDHRGHDYAYIDFDGPESQSGIRLAIWDPPEARIETCSPNMEKKFDLREPEDRRELASFLPTIDGRTLKFHRRNLWKRSAPWPRSWGTRTGSLISGAPSGRSSTEGGNLTLFAFDAGQELAEHTSPFEALVMVLEGSLTLTIAGKDVPAAPGTIVRLPAGVPHAVSAPEPARMLLLMLREPSSGASS